MKQLFQLKTAAYMLSTSLLLTACDKDDEPGGQPTPPAGAKYLNVVLKPYISKTNADSAVAIWLTGNTRTVLNLAASNDTFKLKLSYLTAGNGRLTIQLYTKNGLGNKLLQYERSEDISSLGSANINVQGPESFNDTRWKPRIIFNQRSSNTFNVTAFIGIRPDDPYFELKQIDPDWRHRITIERAYFKQGNPNEKLAGGLWDCRGTCLDAAGNYTNTTFFQFLPQQINGRPWDRVEFTVRFYKTEMEAGEMNFDQNF